MQFSHRTECLTLQAQNWLAGLLSHTKQRKFFGIKRSAAINYKARASKTIALVIGTSFLM